MKNPTYGMNKQKVDGVMTLFFNVSANAYDFPEFVAEIKAAGMNPSPGLANAYGARCTTVEEIDPIRVALLNRFDDAGNFKA